MGVNSRRPLLPAPTESIVDTTGSSLTTTDMATDVSRRTDKSSYSLPDDGSPITISTKRRSHKKDEDDSKLSRSSHQSQTSLLIEYFEGGKSSSKLSSRPSVRVKVIPSGSRKSRDRDQNETIQIRESGGSSRRPHYTRRISLSTPTKQKMITEDIDDQSISDDEQGDRPLEIEFLNRGNGSELSSDRYIQPTSEISSMPAESMLDSSVISGAPRRKRSQSLDKARDTSEANLLKAPGRQRSRSLSRERIAYRVAQKLNAGDVSGGARGRELLEAEAKPLKKRSHKHHDEEQPSVESSLLSGSNVSSRHKSGDAISFRSNTSKSSLNNTKFLETVEDAIRRLILPELKELKKDQKVSVNKNKFDRDIKDAAGGSSSKDIPQRRLSKHSSAPDVSKSSLFVAGVDNQDEVVTPEERRRRHKERRREREVESASPDESKRIRKGSIPGNQRAYTEQELLRRQKSKGLRDAAAAGIVGSALTAAALQHHDSKSSLDKKSRKHRSKSRSSKSASIHDSETELVFEKHNVPPMPFRSDIDTELTRDSILSQKTADPENHISREVQEVIRGSPRDLRSPAPESPIRTTYDDHQDFDDELDGKLDSYDDHFLLEGAGGAIAAAAAENLLGYHPDHGMLDPEDDIHHPRALSPIQSVASEHDLHESHVEEENQELGTNERRYSIESLSSAPSTELARSTRPEGVILESRSEILKQHDDEQATELGYETTRNIDETRADWNEESPIEGHNLDDGEIETDYADSPKRFNEGAALNPGFVTADTVESAVASLLEPSMLDARSGLSQAHSQADSLSRSIDGGVIEEAYEYSQPADSRRGSPLKYEYGLQNHDEKSFTKRLGAASPPQSVTQSEEEIDEHNERFPLDTTIIEEDYHPDEDQFEDGEEYGEESEINTNPSIIQGPIGSVPQDARDHWPYNPTPPQTGDLQSTSQHDATAAIGGVLGAGLGLAAAEHKNSYDQTYDQGYIRDRMFSTPPGAKDEGYISAANPMSPSNATPEPRSKFSTLDHENPPLLFDNRDLDEDPFINSGQQRHFSGYSHGMGSPIYDGATGHGMDSIESKDIIALMNHLTVRDAQRNARDTEILVTLVRSAAEMRSSFLEMKKYIAEQDEILMQANEKQHERTRAIGGPRPLPASRSNRQLAADSGEEVQAKRRNVFRRALKSLSGKSSNDLTKIEDMLEQLLDEVEALRSAQEGRSVGTGPVTNATSFNSTGNGGAYTDGYEPEGQAGTGSPGEQSGYTSNSSRPVPDVRQVSVRRASENRISTVPEGDEEAETYEQPLLERDVPYDERVADERNVPEYLRTPPRKPVPTSSGSKETTPRKSEEKSRKHKSSNSSFFKISRWSKTTASSAGEGIRSSIQTARKDRPSSEMSRSASDLANQNQYNGEFYDPHGDDRLRSSFTLEDEQQDNRPPSPLVPSQVSEGPKYKAHRDSFNLQHPQPQKGPTDRYQTHLESQAQDYAPKSPTSERWGSQSSLPHYSTGNANRYSGANSHLTPISDAGYSDVSSKGPPRPPKVQDAGPLVPQRPPKVKGDESSAYSDGYAQNNRGSASPSSHIPIRKPTGPRPITSSGQYSPSNIKRHQYRGSPNRIDYDDGY